MNEEYFKKEFAYMFERPAQWANYAFELETPDGWNYLLFNLFTIIAILDKDKHVRLEQVKSKFAGLRFYFEWTGPDRKPTLHDRYVDLIHKLPWSLRKFLGSPSKKWDPTHEQIYDIVSLFEQVSYKICETCGEPGRTHDGPWVYTACEACHEKSQKAIQEKKEWAALEKAIENERLLGSGHLQPEDV